MQMKNKPGQAHPPLLTIAIPTYNRAEYLELCLKRIGEEIESLSEDERSLVNIYVSDNASPDDTPNVIAQFQKEYTGIFEAMRNEENAGADCNIAQCYESARTPYVWIVGDDDIVLPGGLKTVLDALLGEELDVLYVNNYWFAGSYLEKPKCPEMHGTLRFQNRLEFARRTNVMLTYISGLIVRSGVGSTYRSELTGSNLVQLSWVLPLLRDGKRFAIIQDWVVAAKAANTGGYGLVRVFGKNLSKIASSILADRPELTRAIQNGVIVNFFPGFALNIREGKSNFEDRDMKLDFDELYGNNWRYYLFLLPLVTLPIWAARRYQLASRVLRRLLRPILI